MQYRARIPTHMRRITRGELSFSLAFLPAVTISSDTRYTDGDAAEVKGESGARRDFRSAPADNAHFTPTRIGT